MIRHEDKIQEVHLCRRASVYVCQSTLVQVYMNTRKAPTVSMSCTNRPAGWGGWMRRLK